MDGSFLVNDDITLMCTKIQRWCHDFPVVFHGAGWTVGAGFWSGVWAWSTQHHQADRLGVKSQLWLVWSS